jgi:hypothetical protein
MRGELGDAPGPKLAVVVVPDGHDLFRPTEPLLLHGGRLLGHRH